MGANTYARKARDRVFLLETSIHNRPDEINDRSQFGTWKGDLMIFARAQGNANVATLIERKTRCTVLLYNNDRKSRPLVNRLINGMSPLPADARRSITFDQGFEFTSWRELHKGMGTRRGSVIRKHRGKGLVENMNKRVRRSLPWNTASADASRATYEVDLRSPECAIAQMPRLPNTRRSLQG